MDATNFKAVILVVDDDDAVARVVGNVLERAGYDARTAYSEKEAMVICDGLGRAPDLLLTDVVMPVTTGPELLLKVIGRYGAVRCIFMSGFPEEWLGQLRGFTYELLHKPFDERQLLDAVGKILVQPVTRQ